MKQLLQDFRSGELRVRDVPPPACLPNGILIQTAASLISSGTERATVRLAGRSLAGKALERPDLVRLLLRRLKTAGLADVLATVRSRLDSSMPLGYSCAGVVMEAGRGAEEFVPGDRVACAGAGYANHAEINWVPKNLCVKLPPEVDFDSGASAALGAIALQGVRVAEVKLGERVVVIGLGLLGLLSAQILKAAGCTVWGLDPDPGRVELARNLGVDFACENRDWKKGPWIPELAGGEGADAVLLTAATRSAEPVQMAGTLARDRAVVVVIGDVRVDVPRDSYFKKELQVRYSRSYGPGRYDESYEEKGIDYPAGYVRWTERRNMQAYLGLLAAGRVDFSPLVTHRYSVDSLLEAYEVLSGKRKQRYVAMLVEYPAAPRSEKRVSIVPQPRRLGESRASVGIGWIGAGNFSRAKLLPALRRLPGISLGGVANATGASSEKVARTFGFRYCSTDPYQIIADPAVDAVFVGTRHDLHARLTIDALRNGKHVFVEKPLCVTADELREIAGVYSASSTILTVGFNRRFSPFARECRRLFGEDGAPLSIVCRVNAGRLPGDHWIRDEEQGGRIVGEVCHFVDLVHFLAGSTVAEVHCVALGGLSAHAEDDIHVHLALANGTRAEIVYLSSSAGSLPKERIEVSGQGKTAVCEDFRKSCFYDAAGRRTSRLWSQDKGHREELRCFIEAIRVGGEPPIPFDSLCATSLATLRIRESLLAGRPLRLSPADWTSHRNIGTQSMTPTAATGQVT